MKLQHLKPMLTTENIKETIDYYLEFLGFTCDSYDEERGWASVSCDNVTIMFSVPNAHIPFEKPELTGSLYIYTDNVDSLWEKLRDRANICYSLETFAYGMREFGIYDNNGYLLKFGQAMQE